MNWTKRQEGPNKAARSVAAAKAATPLRNPLSRRRRAVQGAAAGDGAVAVAVAVVRLKVRRLPIISTPTVARPKHGVQTRCGVRAAMRRLLSGSSRSDRHISVRGGGHDRRGPTTPASVGAGRQLRRLGHLAVETPCG
ncbi:MAG: hypothetical protein M3N47_06005 [Chloroflexota bacterium]|nr:hypothetical protein [Chloroflexota bacterium]